MMRAIKLRMQVNAALRQFLFQHGYLEVDVPVLAPSLIPESYLEAFATTFTSPQKKPQRAFLTASPEAFMKRLLSKLVHSNLFYLGHAFRNNEPTGALHNHEFTLLEWYKMRANYRQLMDEIEAMIRSLSHGYEKKWERISVAQAIEQFVPKSERSADFSRLYVQYLEPNLGTRGVPTFITDFPAESSPLAKTNPDGTTAQRFEMYINGIELINGWTELTDWRIQEKNLRKEQQLRTKLGKEPIVYDETFISALKRGMPSCSGAAMGVDRLIMVLGGFSKLSDVILFPCSTLF